MPKEFSKETAYRQGFLLTDLMEGNVTGIVTAGDDFIIADKKENLKKRLKDFKENDYTESGFKNKYQLGKNYAKWVLEK